MTYEYTIEKHRYTLKLADSTAPAVVSSGVVANVMAEKWSPIQESLYVIIPNIQNRIIDIVEVVKGSLNMTMCTPSDILIPVLLAGANRAIIAHNHPSGDVKPSEDDLKFTRKIQDACKLVGIKLLDHVIFSNDPSNYYSFTKQGFFS